MELVGQGRALLLEGVGIHGILAARFLAVKWGCICFCVQKMIHVKRE